MHDTEKHPHGQGSPGYEQSDANVDYLAKLAIALAVLVVVAVLLMRGLFGYFAARDQAARKPASPLVEQLPPVPPPRLQVNQAADLTIVRTVEHQALHSYAWVDKNTGVVRIPIDRAMDLVLERGLPARKPAPQEGQAK